MTNILIRGFIKYLYLLDFIYKAYGITPYRRDVLSMYKYTINRLLCIVWWGLSRLFWGTTIANILQNLTYIFATILYETYSLNIVIFYLSAHVTTLLKCYNHILISAYYYCTNALGIKSHNISCKTVYVRIL